MNLNLGTTIPTDYVIAYNLDGNGNSTTGTNNASPLNALWVKSGVLYQAQCLSWGASTSFTYASVTYTNSYIWIYVSGVWTFTKNSSKVTATALNGVSGERYAGLKFFNRTLTADEEQILMLEGKRQLGPSNIASYPQLMEGLNGMLEITPGTTEIFNIVTGNKSTYTSGTNANDNLGNNRAITNPNYSHTSITFTNSYVWKNGTFTKNDAGITATTLNGTGTYGTVYMFNRTFTTAEEGLLQVLTSKEYIYPCKTYDLPNLREGLVLDLNAEGKDLSGNNNHGTLVNAPQVVRQGRSKGLSYNGGTQYILLANNNDLKPNLTKSIYFTCGIKTSQIPSAYGIIYSAYDNNNPRNSSGFIAIYNTGVIVLTGNGTNIITSSISVNDGKYHKIDIKLGASAQIWIDGILRGSGSLNMNAGYSTREPILGNVLYGAGSPQFYYSGQIFNPRINNIELGARKTQEGYYSQKGNFIY